MNAAAPHWHVAADAVVWAQAIADDTASRLRDAIDANGSASLLVSGGSSPVPVFERLSNAGLDWARVTVGLVDERWLPPTHDASNGRLVREHLLRDHAAAAHFHPLAREDGDRRQAVADANAAFPAHPTIVLLGMGDDGHTASLFPGMAGLVDALAAEGPYIGADADGCPGAQAWPARITLTPAALALARTRALLIRGERKRILLEQALADGDPLLWPVLAAVRAGPAPLQVYWCP